MLDNIPHVLLVAKEIAAARKYERGNVRGTEVQSLLYLHSPLTADTWRNNYLIITSKRRYDVVLT